MRFLKIVEGHIEHTTSNPLLCLHTRSVCVSASRVGAGCTRSLASLSNITGMWAGMMGFNSKQVALLKGVLNSKARTSCDGWYEKKKCNIRSNYKKLEIKCQGRQALLLKTDYVQYQRNLNTTTHAVWQKFAKLHMMFVVAPTVPRSRKFLFQHAFHARSCHHTTALPACDVKTCDKMFSSSCSAQPLRFMQRHATTSFDPTPDEQKIMFGIVCDLTLHQKESSDVCQCV